jgi:TetR/AcrR family transcriptional repressor of nem operon
VRYSGEHKAETRKRVLQEASREIRAKGPDNVAVASVMARAGLTHGGFYAHFPSKDALIAEAVETMFDDARARSSKVGESDDPRTALRGYVDFYLSRGHRDARERGCPLPSLAGDFARTELVARERFGTGIASLTKRLAKALRGIGAADPDAEASAMLAQMVGAVVLARATEGAASDTILDSAHATLLARYNLGDA